MRLVRNDFCRTDSDVYHALHYPETHFQSFTHAGVGDHTLHSREHTHTRTRLYSHSATDIHTPSLQEIASFVGAKAAINVN